MIATRPVLMAAVIVLGMLGIAAPAPALEWRTYTNARFGTTADVPADWTAGPEPANGDGLAFTSPDGSATIAVWGNLQAFDTVGEAVEHLATPGDGETITYSHRDARSVVVSGTRDDRIFYRKSVLSCRDAVWNNLAIDYPAADKADYDALVTHVARSLNGGSGYQTGDCR